MLHNGGPKCNGTEQIGIDTFDRKDSLSNDREVVKIDTLTDKKYK